MNHNKQRGFTLIELLIAVLILAILATIAYPSYQTYILNDRLDSARTDLLANARQLETYYARHHTFSGLNTAIGNEVELKQNEFFTVSLDTDATTADDYVFKAEKNDKNPRETRFLRLESGSISVCTSEESCVSY